MRTLVAIAAASAFALANRTASAGEPGPSSFTPAQQRSPLVGGDVRVIALFGMFGFFDSTEGNMDGTIGGAALARFGLFEVGAVGQASGVFSYSVSSGAGLAGIALQMPSGLRGDLLGELGGDSYSGVGKSGFLGSDPGVSGLLPYAGVRLGLSYRLAPRELIHPEIGLSLAFTDDLGRKTVHETYQDFVGSFSDAPPKAVVAHAAHVVGEDRFSAVLTVGAQFDTF